MPRAIHQKTIISTAQEKWSDGFWSITSPDLPGLFLAGKDLAKLMNDVPFAIQTLFLLNYKMRVEVSAATKRPVKKDYLKLVNPARYIAVAA